jgi:peptide deformylase
MALRQIRLEGDPILLKKCNPVKEMTPHLLELAHDMVETMYEANGVGLAAPQVGVLRRMVVIDVQDGNGPYYLINPVITEKDGVQTGQEGCLSVPNKVGIVTRPNHVICEAYDLDMKPYKLEGEGLLARAICHELDHLDGVMYTSKVEGDLMEISADDGNDEDYEGEE